MNSIIKMREPGSHFYNGFKEFCEYLTQYNIKNIIEIGAYIGESTELFKEFLGEVNIITIDPFFDLPDENDLLNKADFSKIEDAFNKRMFTRNNYAKLKFTSDDAFQFLKTQFFDLIYIDGLHTYEQVCKDIDNYLPLLKPGGLITGHDYNIPIPKNQESFYYDIEGQRKVRLNVSKAVDEKLKIIKTFQDTTWVAEQVK